MQETRRTNRDRSEAMRAELIAAARLLFLEKGYAGTGTPEIVAAAGVTRGALYHHFADKQALFDAVIEYEAASVAAEIEKAPSGGSMMDALLDGAGAYLRAMQAPGRTRLLLLDGPAVLGRARMDEIDAAHGNRTLREGLEAAMRAGRMIALPADTLTTLLGAMFDRAALAVEQGAEPDIQLRVMTAIISGLES